MNSSKTRKVKYSSTYNFPVSLSEYLVCEDGTKEALFKFYNGVNQTLNEFSFTISEYDANNMLLRTSKVNVKQIVNPNSLFVPKSKFVMNPNTVFIKYNLLYAKFDHLVYNAGELIRRNVVLDLKDEKIPERKRIDGSFNRKEKKQYRTNEFLVTSLNDKYRTKGKSAFVAFLAFLMLIFSAVLIFTYKSSTNIVNYLGYDYNLTLELNEATKTCTIIKYEGNTSSLVIAEEYYGNKVTTIDSQVFMKSKFDVVEISGNNEIDIKDNAFAFSDLSEIRSNAKLYIGADAFALCRNLRLVQLENATNVESFAFRDCFQLSRVNLSRAQCSSLAFENCLNIETLFIGDALTPTFANLFSRDGLAEPKIRSLGYFSNTITRGFFSENAYYNNFSYNIKAFIEDEALPDANRYNGGFDEY